MRLITRGGIVSVLASAALVLAGPTASFAGINTTNGDHSILGGNQVNLPVSAPINLSGNAVGAGGPAAAASETASVVRNDDAGTVNRTSGEKSIGGGNQISAPISAPVNVCGNAVAVLGVAKGACKGAAVVVNKSGPVRNSTNGDHSILGGNQVHAPVSAPVNLCGNAISVAGSSLAACKAAAVVLNKDNGTVNRTSGEKSIGGGNQVHLPVSVPVNVCGNAVAALGVAKAFCNGISYVCNGKDCPQNPCAGNLCNPCTGDLCNPPPHCHGKHCPPPPCHGKHCPPPCHGRHCPPPPCHGDHCPPPCHGKHCPPCHDDHCGPPPCHGNHCPPPPCHGDQCPPCHDEHCGPPPCHGEHCGPPPCEGGHCGPPPCEVTGHCGPPPCEVTGHCGPPRMHHPGSGLPFTGAPIGLLASAALGLVGSGAALRFVSRRRKALD